MKVEDIPTLEPDEASLSFDLVSDESIQAFVQSIEILDERISKLESELYWIKHGEPTHTHEPDHYHDLGSSFPNSGYHTHSEYAESNHTHWEYAESDHTHLGY